MTADARARSRTYPRITAIVLVAGWFVVPVLGWIAGLVMIGIASEWTRAVRQRAITVSVAAAVISGVAFMLLRGEATGLIGLGILIVVPLITNIFVSSYLNQHWGEGTPTA